MAKKISLFNHKGGVSKTTTAFNLGWMLASKGKKVVLVDADPQCNLTGMVLGYKGPTELEKFYDTETQRNIRAGLTPAFESRPKLIEAIECIAVPGQPNLFLLPGHIRLAEYEVTLGIAQEISSSIQTLQNLPGSISYLLDRTAEKFGADYLLIDMNPSLGSLNQNLLMTSDFFLVPTSPDFFSVMAIDSLASFLPKWSSWSKKAASLDILREATYPYPETTPKFLGTIVQKYRPRGGEPATAFKKWIDRLEGFVSSRLVPALQAAEMLLPPDAYKAVRTNDDYCLASIPDFNSLIARSQEEQTPVFALTENQIAQTGNVLISTVKSRDEFRQIFSDLADKVIALTNYETGA